MFKHLLVPLDGSPLAEQAVVFGAGLARAAGGRMTLLHLIERDRPATVHGARHLADEGAAADYLADITSRLEGLIVDAHVHRETVARIPAAIVEHADEFDCDTIVLCTHGRGGVRHGLFGTNAGQIVRLGRTPVLAVPPEPRTASWSPAGRLLLAFDPRPGHAAAVVAAGAAATALGAAVDVLAVAPTRKTVDAERAAATHRLPAMTDELLELEAKEIAARVTMVTEQLLDAGVTARGLVARGESVSGIEEAAGDLEVDFVVLCSHGRGGLAALWEGSIGARLLRRASVPLLLVPATATEENPPL